jgi:hypothetical protein
MKKKNLLFIIIFSTVVSIVNMGYYSYYVNKPRYYEENKSRKQEVIEYKKDYISKENINNDNQNKVVEKVEDKISNTKAYLESEDLAKKELSDVQKGNENLNKDIPSAIDSPKIDKGIEDDYNTNQQSLSVFKVSTGRIVESLTASDKIKLLYISFKLGKDNYKKVEEYLNDVEAEEGVLKALKLLKEDLSEKEYEKVRKIAGKFIDMDAVERLK